MAPFQGPPAAKRPVVVGLGGLEPPTSRLSSARSNQLSYKPGRKKKPHARPAFKAGRDASLPYPYQKERRRRRGPAKCGLTGRLILSRMTNRPTRASPSLLVNVSESRKEVIQPQVPLRLPCYDFTPVADPTVVVSLLAVKKTPSGRTNSHGVTGGVYKARERIHRSVLICDY